VSVRAVGSVVLLSALTSCAGGARRMGGGPPPEYERPTVPEWDAGKPVDPLEQAAARGEPVDEPEGPISVADAGDAGAQHPDATAH